MKKILLLSALFTLLIFMNSPLKAGPFLKIDTIDAESEFPMIKTYVTVRDPEKGVISGISEENLSIYEDGFLVNYVRVKNLPGEDNRLNIVLNIDSSKSISRELLKSLKKSAGEMINYTSPGDMIALYRFNDEVLLLNNFTENRAEISKNINRIERHGSRTMFYNSLYDAIDILNKTTAQKKAVVVFTDGKDEGSSIEIDDVIKFAKDTGIPIYCITFNPQERGKLLSRMCFLTGGKLFNSDKKDIGSIYKTIIHSIKSRYLMEYKTMLAQDGNPHNIEVRLKYDGLRDREQASIIYKKPAPVAGSRFKSISLSLNDIVFIAVAGAIIIFLLVYCYYKNIFSSKKENKSEDMKAAVSGKIHAGDVSGITEKEEPEERVTVNAWLVERDGAEAGKKIPIEHPETIIGRDKNNHVVIEDKSVSKKHTKIKFIKKSFYIFDMASDNGTYLNENKLLRPKLLYDWDEIRIGKKIYIFRTSNIA